MKKSVAILCCFICFTVLILSFFYQGNNYKKLSGGYIYYPENKHILGKVDIPPFVIDYKFNKDFIVVKQKPAKYHNIIYDDIEYIYKEGRDSTYYWLIINKENLVLGPLNRNEFNIIQERYQIPKKLWGNVLD